MRMFVSNPGRPEKSVLQSSVGSFSFIWISGWRAVSIPLFPCLLPQVADTWKRLKGISCSLATLLTPPFPSFPACLSLLTRCVTAVPPLGPRTEPPVFHKPHLPGCWSWAWDGAGKRLRAKLKSSPVPRDATTCYLCCHLPPCCFFWMCADFILVKLHSHRLHAQVLSFLMLWPHWSADCFGPLFFHHCPRSLPTSQCTFPPAEPFWIIFSP